MSWAVPGAFDHRHTFSLLSLANATHVLCIWAAGTSTADVSNGNLIYDKWTWERVSQSLLSIQIRNNSRSENPVAGTSCRF